MYSTKTKSHKKWIHQVRQIVKQNKMQKSTVGKEHNNGNKPMPVSNYSQCK